VGIVGAARAAVFGIIDWLPIKDSAAKRVADWHERLNAIVLLVFAASFYLRTTGGMRWVTGSLTIPFVLSVPGVILIAISGYLGGEPVFRHGVAVNSEHKAEIEIEI